MDQTSKVMPKWMQIKIGEKPVDPLMSKDYNSFIDVNIIQHNLTYLNYLL